VYNFSTANFNYSHPVNQKVNFYGNSFFYGVVTPDAGGILRANATVEILSILTYISDCESTPPPQKNGTKQQSESLFVSGMVRVNNEYCIYNSGSFKGLASLSSMITPVPAVQYHDLNVSGFTLNLVLQKSPFYKNVQQSYYVSFGTILTIVMLAAIDMYWFVEAFVPWLGYFVYVVMTLCIRCRDKGRDAINKRKASKAEKKRIEFY